MSAEQRLRGTALSPGVAIGRACFISQKTATAEAADSTCEQRRLAEALVWMSQRLEALAQVAAARLGVEEADIFHAYRMMLEDQCLRQQLFEDITARGLSAEAAVAKQFETYRAQLGATASGYLQQRSDDIADIGQSILDRLRRNNPGRCCRDTTDCSIGTCRLGNDHILIATALSASLPIELDHHTVGFLVEQGSRNSHAVILARALQLPVVGNIHNLPASIPFDSLVLINGDAGEVILNPAAQTLACLHRTLTDSTRVVPVHDPVPELKVMANINRAADVHQALTAKADGIGLCRTEIEVLAEKRVPGEAEQAERYRVLADAMGERPVTIRLLDLGADKDAEWLSVNSTAGSIAGCRGTRLLLACPELLRDQARALARAAIHRPIDVLYPMVIDLDQFVRLRTLFESCVADLKPALLRHGVMFEVPSACLQARQILEVADFGSIGTNDLIQYLFADDRTCSDGTAGRCFEHHAVLWQLIEQLACTANKAGKPLSICGEVAGNADLTRRIMQAGITVVSAGPGRIAAVRRAAHDRLVLPLPDSCMTDLNNRAVTV